MAAASRAGGEEGDRLVAAGPFALRDQPQHLAVGRALDVAETQAHGAVLHCALHLRGVDVQAEHGDAAVLGLVNEAVGSVEAHRLLVQQRTEELRAVVHPQPRRLVGEQAEGSAVGLGESEAGEALDHLPDPLGGLERRARVADRAFQEAFAMTLQQLPGALAAHRPSQTVGLAGGIAGESFGDLHDLVLEDDRAERLPQDGLERRMLVGDLVAGVLAQLLATLDVRIDRASLDRPGPHDRDLDRQVLEIARPCPQQRLHLRAALDLKDADGVRGADRPEGLGIVVGDPREVDPQPLAAVDLLDAALDRGEHPQAEQIDLQEARVGAGVLVPLHHLPALHRGGHDGAAVDQRPGRDDHPAGVLGEMPGQSLRLLDQPSQPAPALRAPVGLGVGGHQVLVALAPRAERHLAVLSARPPRIGAACDPLDLAGWEAEHLAQLAHCPPHAERRKGRDQRRAVVAEAVVHARDQPLANVAGEVEVDIGKAVQVLVQETPQCQAVLDGIDVREPGQVADQRGDGGAPPPPGRQQRPHGVRAADLDRDLTGKLEHLVMEQEEAGQPEPIDHLQLL